jgi:transposase
MFVRKKANRSGSFSIQIITKVSGKYKVLKSIGCVKDPVKAEELFQEVKKNPAGYFGQEAFNFEAGFLDGLITKLIDSIDTLRLVGPELVLRKIFTEIGFSEIPEELFRELVITRLVYPVSKLKTVDYIFKHKGIIIDINKVYRYLDKIEKKYISQIQQISYRHAKKIVPDSSALVFYDVTTIYFESEEEDDLRKTGFSKEGKHRNPQILLGLLVNVLGFPLGYEIFEGNAFEGHTMLPVIEKFRKRYCIQKIIIVADSGLISQKNISELDSKGYEYIIGARIKSMGDSIKQKILALKLKTVILAELQEDSKHRLIISYSEQRAIRDRMNRARGMMKLEKSILQGKLTKKHIMNRGYNKFLKLTGQTKVQIDKEKLRLEEQWDGLKGYLTNTQLSKEAVIEQYRQLWQIEKSFRISKTDLRIRPIYHRVPKRINAHICIALAACVVYKELERQLKLKESHLSPEKVIDILKTIYEVLVIVPESKKVINKLIIKTDEQKEVLALFDLLHNKK